MKIFYLEGFSSGPGLPFPLLSNINSSSIIIIPYMSYYYKDILFNPFIYFILLFLYIIIIILIPKLLNYKKQLFIINLIYFLLFIYLIYLIYYFKQLCFYYTFNLCINSIKNEINKHKPDIIIGYSWGGAITTQLIEKQYWSGHTILIAPASKLLYKHCGYNSLPSLKSFHSIYNKHLFIIQGTLDGVVPYNDNWELYLTAIDQKNNETNHMIHFLEAVNYDHSLYGYVTRSLLKNIIELMEKEDNKSLK